MQATLLRTGATASSVYASARHHAESLYRPSTPFEERVEQERQPEAPMAALWGRAAAGATAGSTETTSVAPALRPQNIFPHQLLQVLSDAGNASAIAWLRHGHAFAITDPMAFAVHIMPRFTRGKLASFQRQLNIYGFRKVTKGADSSAGALVYFHPAFKRGRPEMLDGVKRIACKGALSLNRLRHDDVPYDVNVPSELTEQPELDVNSLDLHPPQAELCKRQRIVFAGFDGVEESEAARKRRRCLEEPPQRHGGGLAPGAMEPRGSAAQYSPEVRALPGRLHAEFRQKGRADSRVARQKQLEAQRRQYMMHLAAEKWASKTKALESRDGSGQGIHEHGDVAQSLNLERHRRTAAVSASSSSAAAAAASAVSREGVADATPLERRSWLPSGMRTPSGATGVSSYTRANIVGDAGLVLPDMAGAGSRHRRAPWAGLAQQWRGQDADENEETAREPNYVEGGCPPRLRLDPQGEVTEGGLLAAGTTFELRSSGAMDAATSGSAASTWQEATSRLALQAEAQAGHQVSAAAKVSTTAHMPEADEGATVTGPWVPLISYLEDDVDYSKLFEF